MTKQVVGIFCGSLVQIDKNYDVPKGEINADFPWDHCDTSLSTLVQDIPQDENTKVFAFDGSRYEKFAFDIEKIADGMVENIRKIADANPDEKINVSLIGHSRGCLSIIDVVKKINQDPKLRDKVEFTLDLRDPVPGNLDITTKADTYTKMLLSNAFSQIQHCSNVKAAHVTVMNSVSQLLGFMPMVPRFHPNTKLEVEILPGSHAASVMMPLNVIYGFRKVFQTRDRNALEARDKNLVRNAKPLDADERQRLDNYNQTLGNAKFDKNAKPLTENELKRLNRFEEILNNPLSKLNASQVDNKMAVYDLGLNKSRQILLENGVNLYKRDNMGNITTNDKDEPVIIKHDGGEISGEAKDFQDELIMLQNLSYGVLLNNINNPPDPQSGQQLNIEPRQLHFGGKFGIENSAENATVVNMRHAQLSTKSDPQCWLGFKGSRIDIASSFKIDSMITDALDDNNLSNRMQKLDSYISKNSELDAIKYAPPDALKKINSGDPDAKRTMLLQILLHSKTHNSEKKLAMETIFNKRPLNNKQAEYLRHQLLSHMTKDKSKEDVLKLELDQYSAIKQSENSKADNAAQKKSIFRTPSVMFNAASKAINNIKPIKNLREISAAKLEAAAKFSLALDGKEVTFKDTEIKALSAGRLGKLVSRYEKENSLPKAFVDPKIAMQQNKSTARLSPSK